MIWKPVEHTVVKDPTLRSIIHNTGYAVSGNIGESNIRLLTDLYTSLHDFESGRGGMFYSLYSDDIDYRRKVHSGIWEILKPMYDSLFENYKTVINSFIVKTPGPRSDFTLHQDSTGLDELQYSPLGLWIPLQDTDMTNGALCVIPKTHCFFHPYRGISFKSPFADYEDVLRRYLTPITLKAGDILFFDNRIVHYSHLNSSEKERVVVMSGVFPVEADILSVFKSNTSPESPYEIFKQSEDFLITNTAFYKDCTARPYRGEVIRKIYEQLPLKTAQEFTTWGSKNEVHPTNIPELIYPLNTMQIIAEPV